MNRRRNPRRTSEEGIGKGEKRADEKEKRQEENGQEKECEEEMQDMKR